MENSEFTADAAVTENLPTTPSEPTQALYSTNENHDIDFTAQSARGKVRVRHVLRKPTLGELTAREQATPYRSRDVGSDSEEIMVEAGGRADAALYDKLVLEAYGYSKKPMVFSGTDAARAEMLTRIPTAHKAAVIREIYAADAKLEETGEEADVFIWGEGLTYRIVQEIGSGDVPAFTLVHVMREPSERQIQDYRNRSTHYFMEKGTKKPVTRIVTNLSAAVEFYDSLVDSVEGATFDQQPVDASNPEHLKAIDPVFKRQVVDALLRVTQVELGN